MFCPACGYCDIASIEHPDGRRDSSCDVCGWAEHMPSGDAIRQARLHLGTEPAFRLGPAVVFFCSGSALLDVAANTEISAVLCDMDGDTHRLGSAGVPCSLEYRVVCPPWGPTFLQVISELKGE